MAALKVTGFLLGGLGLALFVGGLLWALLAPPAGVCNGGITCEREHFQALLGYVQIVWFAGLLLVLGGAACLYLDWRREKSNPTPVRKPPVRPSPPNAPRAVYRAPVDARPPPRTPPSTPARPPAKGK